MVLKLRKRVVTIPVKPISECVRSHCLFPVIVKVSFRLMEKLIMVTKYLLQVSLRIDGLGICLMLIGVYSFRLLG